MTRHPEEWAITSHFDSLPLEELEKGVAFTVRIVACAKKDSRGPHARIDNEMMASKETMLYEVGRLWDRAQLEAEAMKVRREQIIYRRANRD